MQRGRLVKREADGRGGRAAHDVFLHLLEGGDEEHEGEGSDGRISVGGRDVGDLLNAGGEEEEDVGVFGELLCGKSGLDYDQAQE